MSSKPSASFPVISASQNSIPIELISSSQFAAWLKKQPEPRQAWAKAQCFTGAPGSLCMLQDKNGLRVLCGVEESLTPWSIAHLPAKLPEGEYHLEKRLSAHEATQMALGWALACYRFDSYKRSERPTARLVAPQSADLEFVESAAAAIGWARDLINRPANDLTPQHLADEAARFAQYHKGKYTILAGKKLVEEGYPAIYAVGKAAAAEPHFVDMVFARKGLPRITLVGKGVTFDSGGLDIKSSGNMRLMKKDMGGAAAALALAKMILDAKLPIQLRVLLPMVENAISGNAMRPGDIIATRKGLSVEVGNTDAEGRLILCDALTRADEEAPDLLVDFATLTGAARVALGTDIPAFFTNDEALASSLAKHSQREHDPLWRLPLWKPYRSMLDTPNADLSNDPESSYGGAITAALYLQEFVGKTPSWLHIDMMAWNLAARPGRPVGGEAMAVRALFALIKERYGK